MRSLITFTELLDELPCSSRGSTSLVDRSKGKLPMLLANETELGPYDYTSGTKEVSSMSSRRRPICAG